VYTHCFEWASVSQLLIVLNRLEIFACQKTCLSTIACYKGDKTGTGFDDPQTFPEKTPQPNTL
jgi:hypothetical protein